MNKINPFYALVDEDGDIEEVYPEAASLDWICELRDIKRKKYKYQHDYKIVYVYGMQIEEVDL